MVRFGLLIGIAAMATAYPAAAQLQSVSARSSVSDQDAEAQALVPVQSTLPQIGQTGRVVNAVTGRTGQRQTRDDTATGIKPMERIASRIQNRIQNRVQNRLDHNYTAQASIAGTR